MSNDTYVKGAYLDLAASQPFAKDEASRQTQMELNGQWMKNKNLPLMRPYATWTWIDYKLEFKSEVRGDQNVLILDTPQKIQLFRDHFPQWLIDQHCIEIACCEEYVEAPDGTMHCIQWDQKDTPATKSQPTAASLGG